VRPTWLTILDGAYPPGQGRQMGDGGFVDHGGLLILRLELTGHVGIENGTPIRAGRFARHDVSSERNEVCQETSHALPL